MFPLIADGDQDKGEARAVAADVDALRQLHTAIGEGLEGSTGGRQAGETVWLTAVFG